MLYALYFAVGAAIYATGYFYGRKAAGGSLREIAAREHEADESERESTLALRAAADTLAQMEAREKELAAKAEEIELERMRKINKQWADMMAYTGEVSREDKN